MRRNIRLGRRIAALRHTLAISSHSSKAESKVWLTGMNEPESDSCVSSKNKERCHSGAAYLKLHFLHDVAAVIVHYLTIWREGQSALICVRGRIDQIARRVGCHCSWQVDEQRLYHLQATVTHKSSRSCDLPYRNSFFRISPPLVAAENTVVAT